MKNKNLNTLVKLSFDELWLRIRTAPYIKGAYYGQFEWNKTEKDGSFGDIIISRRKHKRIITFVKTIWHEVGHWIFALLDTFFKMSYTNHSEEEFLEAMEDCLLVCWHLLKEKKQ